MISIQHWELRRLTDLAEYINGYAFKPEDWGEEGLPIIRIEQLRNPASISDFYSGKLSEKNIVQNGDLIFSWSASLFLRIWQYGNAVLNQHLFKVVEKEGVDRVFLKQFIEYYLPEIIKASHGSTMQHITRKELDRFGALFPTKKSEQSKIAEVLSKVDQAIEQTESLIAKQQRIKTGMMQDLLTRGIDEHGNLRSEETHEFKNSPLGRIPIEWEVKRVKDSKIDLVDGDRGENYPKQDDLLVDGFCLFLNAKNVTPLGFHFSDCQYISEIQHRKMGSGVVAKNDIVLTTRWTVGNFALCTGDEPFKTIRINSGMIILRNNDPEILTPYLYESLRNLVFGIEYQRVGSGSAQPQLPAREIKLFHLLKPSQDEQMRIVQACNHIEKVRIASCNSLQKFRSLKTPLMQDLLTGKVRVTALMENMEGKS